MGKKLNAYSILMENSEGKYHTSDLAVDGSIILKFIFKKYDDRAWASLIWLGIWTSGGLLRAK
jgi:hypothetical protein